MSSTCQAKCVAHLSVPCQICTLFKQTLVCCSSCASSSSSGNDAQLPHLQFFIFMRCLTRLAMAAGQRLKCVGSERASLQHPVGVYLLICVLASSPVVSLQFFLVVFLYFLFLCSALFLKCLQVICSCCSCCSCACALLCF